MRACRGSKGAIGGFVLGTTLGLVWTPCAGPVLGSILTVVATSKDTAWASLLLVVYAIGAALADARHRLWRPGRHHPRSQRRALVAAAAAGVRHRRDRLRARPLLPVRHADRGVAHRVLSQRPDRPLLNVHNGDRHDTTIACRIHRDSCACPCGISDGHARRRGADARRTTRRSRSAAAQLPRPISSASATGSIRRRSNSPICAARWCW